MDETAELRGSVRQSCPFRAVKLTLRVRGPLSGRDVYASCDCVTSPICAHLFPSVSICFHLFPSVSICFHLFPSVSICFHLFPSVSICFHLFPSVSICFHLFPSVSICFHLFPSVSICFHLFPSVSICFHLFPSVSICVCFVCFVCFVCLKTYSAERRYGMARTNQTHALVQQPRLFDNHLQFPNVPACLKCSIENLNVTVTSAAPIVVVQPLASLHLFHWSEATAISEPDVHLDVSNAPNARMLTPFENVSVKFAAQRSINAPFEAPFASELFAAPIGVVQSQASSLNQSHWPETTTICKSEVQREAPFASESFAAPIGVVPSQTSSLQQSHWSETTAIRKSEVRNEVAKIRMKNCSSFEKLAQLKQKQPNDQPAIVRCTALAIVRNVLPRLIPVRRRL